MQFGVCIEPAQAEVAARAGYDYAEGTVGGLLMPREPASAFAESLAALRSAPLPYPAVNCFIPGDIKITGPDADMPALCEFVTVAFERAAAAGVEVIVFGSGGARSVPDGFPRERAWAQIVDFCRMAAPLADQQGVTVVAEPLNRTESNVMTAVGECARLVREVDHPAFRLLADGYHWAKDNDSYDDLVGNGELLAHVHIATMPNRLAPGAEGCDLATFFEALREAGYDGRVSIEGNIGDPEVNLPRALAVMRDLA